ncbi:MAG: aminotransferase class V-fold PLP-dependent enzyme, partial [Gammaproteobacteria bacterium]
RDDLIGHAPANTASIMDYKVAAENESMYNTPPTYAWYIAGLVFEWLKRQGGLKGMAAINQRKAEKLYRYIDDSGYYKNPVDPACRSWMNVPFTLADSARDEEFLKGAKAAGLLQLKGHRSVGGMRASIYNAMPESGIDTLIDYMKEFARTKA